MGLFGKKKTDGTTSTTGGMTGATTTTTTTTTTRATAGWQVDCDCGFMLRDHNKDETVQLTKTHVKTSHGQTITDAEALKRARTVTF